MSLSTLLQNAKGGAKSSQPATTTPAKTTGLSGLLSSAKPNTNTPQTPAVTQSPYIENPKGAGYPLLNSDGTQVNPDASEKVNPVLQYIRDNPRTKERVKTPTQFLNIAAKDIPATILDEGERIKHLIEVSHNKDFSAVDRAAALGSAGIGALNTVLAGVAGTFKGAEALPAVGGLAHVVNLIFGGVGEGAAHLAGKGVDSAPISQKTKDTIKPVIEEIAALTSQVALGKAGNVAKGRIIELQKKVVDHVTSDPVINKTEAPKPQGLASLLEKAQKPNELASSKEANISQVVKDAKIETPTQKMKTDAGGNVVPVDLVRKTNPEEGFVPVETFSKEVDGKMNPLFEEAKKYKSAEEFVKAQGESLYRGGKDFNSSLSSDKKIATDFAKNRGGDISEYVLKSDSKVIKYEDIPGIKYKGIDDYKVERYGDPLKFMEGPLEADYSKAAKWAKDNGYDAVRFPTEREVRILNENTLTKKSQLTDIYNQAHTKPPEGVARTLKPAESTGEVQKSKLASSVEEQAVEKKLIDTFGDTPEYNKVNMKEQADLATKLLNDDPERARRIAMGEELPPSNILPESIFTALENKALKLDDVETLRDLATKSTLSSEATAMGQRIRALAERHPDSPIAKIAEVQKERVKAVEKKLKGKTIKKAKAEEVEKIKKEIKKAAPKKETWDEFVSSITCGY
jgi:hypothetical protein